MCIYIVRNLLKDVLLYFVKSDELTRKTKNRRVNCGSQRKKIILYGL